MGARKSPKSWLDRSVAVPTWTRCSPGASGRLPLPSEPQDLASRRRATSREPAARQPDVRPESLDAGEQDEVTGDGALAKQHNRIRTVEVEAAQRRAHLPVYRRIPLVGADGDAEPHRPHRARGGGDSLHGLRDAAILRDLRPASTPMSTAVPIAIPIAASSAPEERLRTLRHASAVT